MEPGITNPNLNFLWVQMVFQGLLLSGTNEVSLDVKGRLAVPVKNREILKEESDGQCVVTRSLFDKCLWMYPVDEWQKVVASLGELPSISDPLCRTIQRIVLGSAVFLTLDAQGRILLPHVHNRPNAENQAHNGKHSRYNYLPNINRTNVRHQWSEPHYCRN